MIGTAAALAGSAIAGIGSSIVGNIAAAGDREKARQALIKANDMIEKLGLPPSQATPIILEQFKQAGIYTPENIAAVEKGVNAYNAVQEDPSLRNAQIKALQQLQDRSVVGLTAEDRVAMTELRNRAGADAEARRQQILQNFRQMGQGGGGASLAAQLQAQQASSNEASAAADRQAAVAAQRALQALTQSGSLAGDIRNTDFSQASQRAQAENEMNRFNIGNQMNVNQANVNARNQANLYNIQRQQNVSDRNVGMSNEELLRQRQGQQQDFQNKFNLTQAQANAQTNLGNVYNNQAAQTGQLFSNIGAGLSGALSAAGQYSANQSALDKTLKNKEADDVISALSSFDFNKNKRPV